MEFKYSDELDKDQHPTGNLAASIPIRCNRYGEREKVGAARARRDWSRLVAKPVKFHGGHSAKYGLIQVAIPECRPERMEILAYASEIGFLYDDHTEFLSHDEVNDANDTMQANFTTSLHDNATKANTQGIGTIQARLLSDMAAIDPVRAQVASRSWVEFLRDAAGRQHDLIHPSFDAYMKYRTLDVGEMFWFGLVTFGMALTVPDHELSLVRELTRPCWVVLALQNDICSWQKEEAAAKLKGASHIVNALWYLMRDYHLTLEEAKSSCITHIETYIGIYETAVCKVLNDDYWSKDSKTYMEALLYTISGDAIWSLICPRYNETTKQRKAALCSNI